jgi:hypothetical protein
MRRWTTSSRAACRLTLSGMSAGLARARASSARSWPGTRTTFTTIHKKGQLLVNGSAEGLVEVIVDPPFHTGRMLSTAFVKERVNSFLVSLVDPDGFIAAIEDDSQL